MPDDEKKPATATTSEDASRRMVQDWMAVVNSGDEAKMTAFLKGTLTGDALTENNFHDIETQTRAVYTQSKGVEIARADYAPHFAFVKLRSRQGNRWAQAFFFLDEKSEGKLAGMFVMPTRDPASEEKWPDKVTNEGEALALIDQRVRKEADADRFSGVVLIAKGDTILYQTARGLADRNFSVPNRIDTKFHLGSMNKMFTAIAIGQLAEAGKLTFDDPLIKVLPDYPNKQAAEKITLRHLLTHTSGLGDFFDSPRYDRRKPYPSMQAMLPIFANDPLAFEPGKGEQYSNAGFIVLGAVIERVAGVSYYDYIRAHIYKPAGMTDSDSYRTDEVVPNLAIGYAHFGDDPFGIAPRRPNHLFLGWRGNSCGGGYATAPDLVKFSRALTGHKLLSPQMTETVTAAKRNSDSGEGYGFGFQVAMRNGKDIRGHSGGGPASGINSDLEIFWNGAYSVVVLGNYDAPAAQDLNRSLCELLAKLP